MKRIALASLTALAFVAGCSGADSEPPATALLPDGPISDCIGAERYGDGVGGTIQCYREGGKPLERCDEAETGNVDPPAGVRRVVAVVGGRRPCIAHR